MKSYGNQLVINREDAKDRKDGDKRLPVSVETDEVKNSSLDKCWNSFRFLRRVVADLAHRIELLERKSRNEAVRRTREAKVEGAEIQAGRPLVRNR